MLHAAKSGAGLGIACRRDRRRRHGLATMRACWRKCPACGWSGVVDPDRKQAALRRHHARMPGREHGRGTARSRRRCRVDRSADPSASRHRARLHRARRPCPGRKADRLVGRRGRRHHRSGAPRRPHPDDRPRRAFQSGGPGDRGSDPQRGHSLDRDHPGRAVSAAHVECRRGHRPRRPRHRPDLLVHPLAKSSRCSRSCPTRSPSARTSRCCSSAPPRACSPTSTPTG